MKPVVTAVSIIVLIMIAYVVGYSSGTSVESHRWEPAFFEGQKAFTEAYRYYDSCARTLQDANKKLFERGEILYGIPGGPGAIPAFPDIPR